MVPSSLGLSRPRVAPDPEAVRHAAEVLNAGKKVALLIGQGARDAAAEVSEVADLLGAGVAKALLGKDVLSDELPWVTGSIGLLGTRPSYEMMNDCDTLLTIGSNFPYTQFLPPLEQARGVQIDVDGAMIGMRYPYEVNLVGDARHHPAGADPAAAAQATTAPGATASAGTSRSGGDTLDGEAMVSADPVNPMRLFTSSHGRHRQTRS